MLNLLKYKHEGEITGNRWIIKAKIKLLLKEGHSALNVKNIYSIYIFRGPIICKNVI